MEPVADCRTYAARPSGTSWYRAGLSAFKVYLVDIFGRAQPELYEWDACGHERESLVSALAEAAIEGVGFVIAFPHITKVFRFAPSAETVMQVRAFRTDPFAPLDLAREEGYMEFACLAEAVIACDEYQLWAAAASVEEYLAEWSSWSPVQITEHTKLQAHFRD